MNESGNVSLKSSISRRSGHIEISTGQTTLGSSGSVFLSTGSSNTGASGGIIVQIGKSGTDQGGSIVFKSGDSQKSHGGNIEITSGSGGSKHKGGDILIVASSSKNEINSSEKQEIAFGFEQKSQKSGRLSLSLRIHQTASGSRVISNVPFQATSIQYSSDSRIKKNITSTDKDDLLDRIQKIELREYGYTDEWKEVRGLKKEIRVRGVIAQELATIFPEHVQIIKEFTLQDKKFHMKDFHQVDKQGLTMDMIGAMQAHFSRYKIHHSFNTTKSLSIETEDNNLQYASTGKINLESGVSKEGKSGNIEIISGEAAKSGNIKITTGKALNEAGGIDIKTGDSEKLSVL